MDTPQATRRALQYILLFRTYLPDKFMVKYEKDKTGLRRAMIFNRPGVLSDVFKTVGIEMPKEYGKTLFEAGKLYQAETGIKPTGPKTKGAAAAGAGAAAGAAASQKKTKDVLFVTAIPPGSTIAEIRSVFERYGVASVDIELPAAAFVRLTTPTAEEVAKATDRKVVIQGGLVNVAVATELAARVFYTYTAGRQGGPITETAAPASNAFPEFNYAAQSPMYGAESPVYNATGEGEGVGGAEGEEAGGAAAAAPSAAASGGPAFSPKTPDFRRAAEYRGGGGTRRRRARAARRSTRKHQDPLHRLGKAFASMWKLHGSSKD
jgi:hypothetical protein